MEPMHTPVPLWAWFAVAAVVVAMLAVDLRAHRRPHVVPVREAAAWSAAWVGLGLAFGGVVWATLGSGAGSGYLAGYVIEKSLAVDNVFVIAVVFASFAVPRELQHRVLFYGVVGALVLRTALVIAGSALVDRFSWVLYVFGAFLVATGARLLRHRPGEGRDPKHSRTMRVFRRLVPSTDRYAGQRFLVPAPGGRRLATPLLAVLVVVEVTDLVFAMDSIPAVFAVTTDPFVVATSNAFAVLGLRALFFLLADLVHRFAYLRVGLAAVLVFVGGKLLLHGVVDVPVGVSLAVVAGCVGASVAASLVAGGSRAGRVSG